MSRLTNQVTTGGQRAIASEDWLNLANRWEQAADLMAMVTADHHRYTEAQARVLSYRQNSEAALARANALTPNPQP